jgi:hypothetical protein
MFKSKWFSVLVGSGLAILLLTAVVTAMPVFAQGPGWMMGGYDRSDSAGYGHGWMMGNTQAFSSTNRFGFGHGWMMGNAYNNDGSFGFGPGWMLQNTRGFSGTVPFGHGWMMGGFFNDNDNGSFGFNPGGMMGGGMMINPNNPFYTAPEPLTLREVTDTLDAYLLDLDDSNLGYEDVMIFENHAYAQIVEKDTGVGVLEVLVDPITKIVYPEMGPNMMWNQEYGMMSGYGRYGMMGMMHGYNFNNFNRTENSSEMTVMPQQAVEAAQTYLDNNYSEAGLTVDEHADPFYGYYTLHVNRDGQTVGMLSVNGFNSAIWPHTWHGALLSMSTGE